MFHWVEARAFCHATEDEEKVLAAIRTVLPEGDVQRDALEGHHGNPLVALAVRIDTAARMKDAWRRIVTGLGTEEALASLEDRMDDDGVYHLRLDKQAAFLGRIARPESPANDVIDLRAKVAAFPQKREIAVKVAREFLEAL